jgi:hypothetical protein
MDSFGKSLLLTGQGVFNNNSAIPSTPFIGVRISWLIFANNWDLA